MDLEELRRQLQEGTLYEEPELAKEPAGLLLDEGDVFVHKREDGTPEMVIFGTPSTNDPSIAERMAAWKRSAAERDAITKISKSSPASFIEVAKAFKAFGGTLKNASEAVAEVVKTAQAFNISMEQATEAFKYAEKRGVDSIHVFTK